jgi:uncharacterized glyoxalase superfamily protein PhnB
MSASGAAKALDFWQRGFDAHTRMFASGKRRVKDLLIPPEEKIA